MIYLWKFVRNTMAGIGTVLIYLGISTSDYYVMELGQTEPDHIWPCIYIGAMCMIPLLIHLINEYRKENM